MEWENDCVRQCESLEVMALETVQRLEEDRLGILILALIKLIKAVRDGGQLLSSSRQPCSKLESDKVENGDATPLSSEACGDSQEEDHVPIFFCDIDRSWHHFKFGTGTQQAIEIENL